MYFDVLISTFMNNYQKIIALEKEKQGTITSLDLSDLKLSFIPNEVFELQELKILIFKNNFLDSLPDSFFSLKNLKKIDFKRNQLTEVNPKIKNLINLEEANFNFNLLSSLPTQIKNLQKLKGLFVSNNLLQNIPTEIGDLTQLESINLRSNQLLRLSLSLATLQNLKFLQVENNQLQLIPSALFKLPNLCHLIWKKQQTKITPIKADTFEEIEELVLVKKNLTEIPDFIFKCKNLKKLILSKNEILKIPAQISNLVKLEELDVQYNLIKFIPNEIFELKNLRFLSVVGNKLLKYPFELLKLENLISFHFWNNLFTNKDFEIFKRYKNITASNITTHILIIIECTKGKNYSLESKMNLLYISIDLLEKKAEIPIDDYFKALTLKNWNIFQNASNYIIYVLTNYNNPSKYSTISFCGDTTLLDKKDYVERLEKLNINICKNIEESTHVVLLYPSSQISLPKKSNKFFLNERLLNHFLNKQEPRYLQKIENWEEQEHIISLFKSKEEENIDIAITLLCSLGVSQKLLYHLVYGLFFYQQTQEQFHQLNKLIYLYGSNELYKKVKKLPSHHFNEWHFNAEFVNNTELKIDTLNQLNK